MTLGRHMGQVSRRHSRVRWELVLLLQTHAGQSLGLADEQIAAETPLDGIYVIRTGLTLRR